MDELAHKASRAGLIVRKCGYFNTLLFPLIAQHRLLQRGAAGEQSHDAALPSPLVNGLLFATFSIEKFVVPLSSFPFGTSILAVLGRESAPHGTVT